MPEVADMIAFNLSTMGLTISLVWPQDGPAAWIREQLLKPILSGKAKQVLDCYICLSFWTGLLLSPIWWYFTGAFWSWFGCLMTPALFWLVLQFQSPDRAHPDE